MPEPSLHPRCRSLPRSLPRDLVARSCICCIPLGPDLRPAVLAHVRSRRSTAGFVVHVPPSYIAMLQRCLWRADAARSNRERALDLCVPPRADFIHGPCTALYTRVGSLSISMRGSRAPNPVPLARLARTVLGWPGTSTTRPLPPIDLTLHPADAGGHVLLGGNGSGKSLLASALANETADSSGSGTWIRSGELQRREGWSTHSASMVSFESHEALLAEGGSVYRCLGMPPGATPSKACKFLIVRFGLHPLLYRPVSALSTGEIRKVLLARALATRPSLLVLDNAFDGLDVPSRAALADLLSMTLRGFSELLVQGVEASATAHTQVLLVTHRAEEIVDEIATVSCMRAADGAPHPAFSDGADAHSHASDRSCPEPVALTTEARAGRTGAELMRAAFGSAHPLPSLAEGQPQPHSFTAVGLPSPAEVGALFPQSHAAAGGTLVEACGLSVGRDGVALLSALDWTVRQGEHWLIAGGNGAGKSTLSRLLARCDASEQGASGRLSVLGTSLGAAPSQLRQHTAASTPAAAMSPLRDGVGWVSTERHLAMARSPLPTADVLRGADAGGGASAEDAARIARWLRLDAPLLARPFAQLSQGEQKLVLIGAALARRPALLVLDEPCQGLDVVQRQRVLSLVERVCSSGGVALVYITHYYEEALPCITHVLQLQSGTAAFMGERRGFESR